MRISKKFRFEAAHYLPFVPAGHKCGRLHGHSFRIEVTVEGPVNAYTGWVMDFAALGATVKPLLERLDHYCLNDIEGLENPTSENVAVWIWERLCGDLDGLYSVRVAETCTSSVLYQGNA